jgi:hypothetical protein
MEPNTSEGTTPYARPFSSMTNTTLTGQVLDVDGGHMIRQYATR